MEAAESSEDDLVLEAGGQLLVGQHYGVEHYQFRLHRHSLTWGREAGRWQSPTNI